MSTVGPPIVVDGHTHIFNRVYWEHIDPWQPQPFGFDFARAFAGGVNVVIENVAPYGYGNFDARRGRRQGLRPELDASTGHRPHLLTALRTRCASTIPVAETRATKVG